MRASIAGSFVTSLALLALAGPIPASDQTDAGEDAFLGLDEDAAHDGGEWKLALRGLLDLSEEVPVYADKAGSAFLEHLQRLYSVWSPFRIPRFSAAAFTDASPHENRSMPVARPTRGSGGSRIWWTVAVPFFGPIVPAPTSRGAL